jgi:hypothetical protein
MVAGSRKWYRLLSLMTVPIQFDTTRGKDYDSYFRLNIPDMFFTSLLNVVNRLEMKLTLLHQIFNNTKIKP